MRWGGDGTGDKGQQFPKFVHRQQAIGGEGHTVVEFKLDAERSPAQAVEAQAGHEKVLQGIWGIRPSKPGISHQPFREGGQAARLHGDRRQSGEQHRQGNILGLGGRAGALRVHGKGPGAG